MNFNENFSVQSGTLHSHNLVAKALVAHYTQQHGAIMTLDPSRLFGSHSATFHSIFFSSMHIIIPYC